MGNCKSNNSALQDAPHQITTDQIDYRKFHSEVVQRLIENKFDIVDTTIQNNLRSKIFHANTGISKHHINDTITSYVDYMILWAYRNLKRIPFEFLPPYNIEMCLRTHILYSAHFKIFIKLLKGSNDFKFDYEPKKMIPSGNLDLKQKYQDAYDDALQTLGAGHCTFIWEHPQRSFMKNEFSFCFTSPERKLEFNKFMIENSRVSRMKSYSAQDIYDFANKFRKRSGLCDVSYAKGKPLPTISDKFVITPEQEHIDVARAIDAFIFPDNFMPTLLWEQMIDLEEGMKWMLEYKKFLFLLLIEGKKTIISPSEKVDQVWHLHLQHYDNYAKTVGSIRFIDHGPSKGGHAEYLKFAVLYDQSVEFVQKYFGDLDLSVWAKNGDGRYGEQGEYIAFLPLVNKKLILKKNIKLNGKKKGDSKKNKKDKKDLEAYELENSESDGIFLREE